MPLESLKIENLRNISKAELRFSLGMNVIAGENASGKTSLLEAIALAVQGRSFRTPRIDHLIRHQSSGLTLVGTIRDAKQLHTLGLARQNKTTQVKLDGKTLSRSTDLIELQSLHVITPESHEILDQGPKMRRQYLDWGVFHVKHDYLACWQRYHRVLRQRNHVLRTGGSAQEVQAWDSSFLAEAGKLDSYRIAYLKELTPRLIEYGAKLLDMKLEFNYRPGWNTEGGSLAAELRSTFNRDQERGFTQSGPHRADLSVKSGGKGIKEVFSRGQQKLLICAMYLAQATLSPKSGILLIDDLPAELDPSRRKCLLEATATTNSQLFVTATEIEQIPIQGWTERKVFHVEHGEFHEVV
jgi:DNA replication and repair protein RecF